MFSHTNPQLERTQEQESTTKKLRFIWAKLATDGIDGEWEPALEPRHLRVRHRGHIQAFIFSFFKCSWLRGLSKEADGPSHWTADVESLVWSHPHPMGSLKAGEEERLWARMQSKSWKGSRNVGSGGVTSRLASHVRCLAALALRDTAEGPYPRTSAGPGSCCMGWLLFCWRPWLERCTCCWSEGHPQCTLSLFQHTLPGWGAAKNRSLNVKPHKGLERQCCPPVRHKSFGTSLIWVSLLWDIGIIGPFNSPFKDSVTSYIKWGHYSPYEGE